MEERTDRREKAEAEREGSKDRESTDLSVKGDSENSRSGQGLCRDSKPQQYQ